MPLGKDKGYDTAIVSGLLVASIPNRRASGEIKEISGSKMTAGGVVASKRCVPRSGPKKK